MELGGILGSIKQFPCPFTHNGSNRSEKVPARVMVLLHASLFIKVHYCINFGLAKVLQENIQNWRILQNISWRFVKEREQQNSSIKSKNLLYLSKSLLRISKIGKFSRIYIGDLQERARSKI